MPNHNFKLNYHDVFRGLVLAFLRYMRESYIVVYRVEEEEYMENGRTLGVIGKSWTNRLLFRLLAYSHIQSTFDPRIRAV